MKKLFLSLAMGLGLFVIASSADAQMNANAAIGRAKAEAQQAGCFDGLAPSLHGTVTGVVEEIRVPCGEAITGLGQIVYLYAPTPCPPNAQICIQVIVPVAEVVFGCGNEVLSVTCLSNQSFPQ